MIIIVITALKENNLDRVWRTACTQRHLLNSDADQVDHIKLNCIYIITKGVHTKIKTVHLVAVFTFPLAQAFMMRHWLAFGDRNYPPSPE